MQRLRNWLRVLPILAFVLYPLAVWFALTHPQFAWTGWLLLLALVPRLWVLLRGADRRREILLPPLLIAGIVVISLVLDNTRVLLAVPTLIALTLLLTFARSLRGTPMVEQYARLFQPDLHAAEIRHCRQATWVWCSFFAVNGSISALLACRRDPTAWALFTGVGSYISMALLFAGEYGLRVARFGFERATPGWRKASTR